MTNLPDLTTDELRTRLSDIGNDIEAMREKQQAIADELASRAATVTRGDILDGLVYPKGRWIVLQVKADTLGRPGYSVASIKKDGTVGDKRRTLWRLDHEKPFRAVDHNLELLEPFEQ